MLSCVHACLCVTSTLLKNLTRVTHVTSCSVSTGLNVFIITLLSRQAHTGSLSALSVSSLNKFGHTCVSWHPTLTNVCVLNLLNKQVEQSTNYTHLFVHNTAGRTRITNHKELHRVIMTDNCISCATRFYVAWVGYRQSVCCLKQSTGQDKDNLPCTSTTVDDSNLIQQIIVPGITSIAIKRSVNTGSAHK